MQNINQYYIGTYQIIDMSNPNNIHSTHEISSKEEFDTLMNQVILFNKNASHKMKRQIIKL